MTKEKTDEIAKEIGDLLTKHNVTLQVVHNINIVPNPEPEKEEKKEEKKG
jgi:hypothetical protein